VRAKRAELEKQRAGVALELQALESGGAVGEKHRELAEIETKLISLQNAEAKRVDADLETKRKEIGRMKFGLGALESELREPAAKIAENSRQIGTNKNRMDILRTEWKLQSESVFEGQDVCPTCGQAIPEDQIEKARATWNINKAEALKGIATEGKKLKDDCLMLEIENQGLDKKINDKQVVIDKLKGEISTLEAEIQNPDELTSNSIDRQKLQQQKTVLQNEIASIIANRTSAIEETKARIEVLDSEIRILDGTLAQIESDAKATARIAELKTEERKLAGEYERLESELFLTEEFVRIKVGMLEGKINSRFQLARFKLFETQINQGINECCEITVNGVPYWSVNNSARINAGIDVANVLSEHYGISAPMWLDNAEAVNEIMPSKNQQIRLIVTKDPILKIGG
jgi:hypothetical protein